MRIGRFWLHHCTASSCSICLISADSIHSLNGNTDRRVESMRSRLRCCLLIIKHLLSSPQLRYCETIGVPIRILPVSPDNALWLLLGNPVARFIESILGQTNLTRFGVRAWIFYDKNRAHLEIGDYFTLITPGKNWLYVCNAEGVEEILHRRHDFPRPLEILGTP